MWIAIFSVLVSLGQIISGESAEKLILTPYIKSGRAREGRDLSLVTGLTPNITSYAGFFTVNEECDSALFFWFFPSQNDPTVDPVSVWLQGGPGSTAFFGLLTENGPYNLRTDGKLELRDYSWNRNSSVIFIDNPVGTGYSYTNKGCYATNQTQISQELLSALEQFFQVFPEFSKNPFFLTGESYAGKYIPSTAHAIMTSNSKINLKGIMIGNGLVDPLRQNEYSDYTYQLGLIDAATRDRFKIFEENCRKAIESENYEEAMLWTSNLLASALETTGFSEMYNYLYAEGEEVPDIDYFVTQNEVRSSLHVGNATWYGESSVVYTNLLGDIMRSVRDKLEQVMEKYRVLIYNGQLDISVAYPLTARYIESLNWTHSGDYKTAPRRIWNVGSSIAGYAKSAGDFTEVLVRNAGHMVPTDQPEWALDLYNRFIFNLTIG